MDNYKIYPKQFRSSKIPIEKNRCFFLMPFKKDFDIIYGTIKDRLQNNGFIVNRADEISGSKPVMNKILTEMLRSQYLIVDLTGYNPNVFYELGIAHSFKDAQNILLIKQKDDRIPFDISYLTYINYEKNNLYLLTSTILSFIEENQYINEFYELLNVHGIINHIDSNTELFVDYIREALGKRISIFIDILNQQCSDINDSDLIAFFDQYTSIISELLLKQSFELLPGVLNTYKELLMFCPIASVAEKYVFNFLYGLFDNSFLKENDITSWKTDFAVGLISQNKFPSICIPWIINYFSRSKSATIDLNRYKIESLLMTSTSKEINNAIINSLHSQDCHIREHISDIIGEKKLFEAKDQLYRQLSLEENFYSANSMIAAIGKIGDESGIKIIERWIESNLSEIIQTKQFFVIKYGLWAIEKLDMSSEKRKFEHYKSKYLKYLEDYFIW